MGAYVTVSFKSEKQVHTRNHPTTHVYPRDPASNMFKEVIVDGKELFPNASWKT